MEQHQRRSNEVVGGILPIAASLAFLLSGTVFLDVARAQVVRATPDYTIEVGPGNALVSNEQIVVDDGLGGFAVEDVLSPVLGTPFRLTGFSEGLDGDRLVAFGTAAFYSGTFAGPADVLAHDGHNFTVVFDAVAAGVPVGTRTDAVSLAPGGLLLSFDRDVDVAGTFVADEDLVRWDGVGFTPVFVGARAGLDRSHDIDAAQDLGGGSFLMSLRTAGSVGGVPFSDEDVLRYQGGIWTLEYDASAADPDWERADLSALMVPEPAIPVGLCSGLLLCLVLARVRFLTRRIGLGIALAFVLGSATASAAPGQWEINASCAVVGCFPGDSPGYPVTINAPGSYLVTGNLVVTATATAGIFANSGDFTLDLGGFELIGPVTCTGSGASVSCDGDSGSGIAAGNDPNVRIHNGFVRGFGFNGIAVGAHGNVHDVVVGRNGNRGISAGAASRIENAISYQNDATGIYAGPGSVVTACVSDGNGIDGVTADEGSTISSSAALRNADDGIQGGIGVTVTGNRTSLNGLTGIESNAGSNVAMNLSIENGGAGVLVGAGSSVQHNHLVRNGTWGINFVGLGSSYRGNDLRWNTTTAINGTGFDAGGNTP